MPSPFSYYQSQHSYDPTGSILSKLVVSSDLPNAVGNRDSNLITDPLEVKGVKAFSSSIQKICCVKRIIMNWDIERPYLIWINERIIHHRSKP